MIITSVTTTATYTSITTSNYNNNHTFITLLLLLHFTYSLFLTWHISLSFCHSSRHILNSPSSSFLASYLKLSFFADLLFFLTFLSSYSIFLFLPHPHSKNQSIPLFLASLYHFSSLWLTRRDCNLRWSCEQNSCIRIWGLKPTYCLTKQKSTTLEGSFLAVSFKLQPP